MLHSLYDALVAALLSLSHSLVEQCELIPYLLKEP